ncbi:helix-turn-helix domain-containing protein [Sphingomonas melonis]|uniref:helix-turn-helix domain-containing protein n=1 Tax=Sphingomonas melonis TaxID=152682 RepID=UPI0035C851F9
MAGAAAVVDLNSAAGDYPFGNTHATRMLQAGLEAVEKDKGWSQRQVAKMLNYKTSVVLSHMALGRVPIPIDRALDFARLLKMPAGEFLMAVLEQRYPEIDWPRHLAGMSKKASTKAADSYVTSELEALAGTELDSLPQQVVNVLRDVVADRNAPRRWMALHEVPIVETLRDHHPHGLSPAKRKELDEFIAKL